MFSAATMCRVLRIRAHSCVCRFPCRCLELGRELRLYIIERSKFELLVSVKVAIITRVLSHDRPGGDRPKDTSSSTSIPPARPPLTIAQTPHQPQPNAPSEFRPPEPPTSFALQNLENSTMVFRLQGTLRGSSLDQADTDPSGRSRRLNLHPRG